METNKINNGCKSQNDNEIGGTEDDIIAKVVITEWGELAIVEKLLSDYTQHTSERKDTRVVHARNLLPRITKALLAATEKLEL
mgnify:CR=1 FL=1